MIYIANNIFDEFLNLQKMIINDSNINTNMCFISISPTILVWDVFIVTILCKSHVEIVIWFFSIDPSIHLKFSLSLVVTPFILIWLDIDRS